MISVRHGIYIGTPRPI